MNRIVRLWSSMFCEENQLATPNDFRLLGQLQMLAALNVDPTTLNDDVLEPRLLDFVLAHR
jgi:hypothetical protein